VQASEHEDNGWFDTPIGIDTMIRHMTFGGTRLAFLELSPDCQPTIIMLHGFRGSRDGLATMAHHLNGFHLLLPDLPGYGESESLTRPHTIENYVAWLDEFIAELDLTNFVVLGHSYGGSIALIHAARGVKRPAATISVSPAEVRRGPPAWIPTWYYRIGSLMPEPWRKRWLTNRAIDRATGRLLIRSATGALRDAIIEHRDRVLPTLRPLVITEQYMSLLDLNLDLYTGFIEMPVLIIAGERDIVAPVARLRKLAALMPQGALEVMHNQGHLAPLERPATTASLTENFLGTLSQ
jgi:pimeloyl-ACP methyl ester carboxylesterase